MSSMNPSNTPRDREYLLGGSAEESGSRGSGLRVEPEPPLYTPEELRVIRDEAHRKSAENATPPLAPMTPEKLAPERFRFHWSPGRKPRDLSDEAHGNVLDFRDYCEKYEGDYELGQLAFLIKYSKYLKRPPFTGNQPVGYFIVNLKTKDGKILHDSFPIHAC